MLWYIKLDALLEVFYGGRILGHSRTGNRSTRDGTEVLCLPPKSLLSQALASDRRRAVHIIPGSLNADYAIPVRDPAKGRFGAQAPRNELQEVSLLVTTSTAHLYCTSKTLPFKKVTFKSLYT
jgi:hypothetical protein